MIEINGMAHVILTVSEWERCRPFYEALLSFLGLTRVFAGEDSIYYVGGRTAVGVGRCKPEYEAQPFVQGECRAASFLLPCAEPRGCRPVLRVSARAGSQDRAYAGGRSLGAGILFGAVRGSRRYADRGQLRPRQRGSRGRRRLQCRRGLPLAQRNPPALPVSAKAPVGMNVSAEAGTASAAPRWES